MKSSFLIATAGLVATASQALAAITVVTPWSTSVWNSGGSGEITWNVTGAESTMNCDIQLLNGDIKNQNLVAEITSSTTPIPCSAGKYGIYPINDFASGKYSIRIGQAATGNWYYSGLFTFNGNGSSKPISVASSASAAPAAASGSAAAASAPSGAPSSVAIGNKAAASGSSTASSASASASDTNSASGVAIHVTAIALSAVAAAAFAL